MNYPSLLWSALAVYALVRFVSYRRLRRRERALRLLMHVARRFDQIQQEERE